MDLTAQRLTSQLRQLADAYPGVWDKCELFFTNRDGLPPWPGWVFLPMGAAYAIASGGAPFPRNPLDVSRIHHLAAWRLTQSIYRFDDEVFAAIASTELGADPLPVDVLLRLPEWCVYIDFEGRIPGVYGAYVALECDSNTGGRELRLLFDVQSGTLMPIVLHLLPNASVTDAILAAANRSAEVAQSLLTAAIVSPEAQEMLKTLASMERQMSEDTAAAGALPIVETINLTIYLCSDAPEIAEATADRPRPKPVKTKTGMRLFPPSGGPRVVRAGDRLAEQLQHMRESTAASKSGVAPASAGGHAPITPHIRRAHWHGYWSGPRTGHRRFDVRWQPPIPVGGGSSNSARTEGEQEKS